ncbi:dynein regulatory complex protein 10-like isoform X2 [Diorhabda carinulata]|uniref:dynein regulatory complex protein 10-like isoform X2 n=1 Tax=Diorhabda carinulata TaxID=1163345 RepID=UPI0025A166EE|nr:dynein regulatory complex protein 10-like isoform X2 [Diorhabda carinulata]
MPSSYTPRSILTDIEIDDELNEFVNRFKDVEMTPDEMNLKIQADRVIYILNICMAKMNTIAHLPFILENDAELIRKHLKPNELSFVLDIFNEWGIPLSLEELYFTDNIQDSLRLGTVNKSMRRSQFTAILPEAFPNPAVYQLVDILFHNKCIQSAIRLAEKPKLDKQVVDLIKLLQELKEITKTKVYVTGEQEKAMDKELRRAYKSNLSLTVVIEDLKEQLKKQRKELEEQLDEKLKIVEMYNEKIQNVRENFELEMGRTLRDSEKEMMYKTLESEEKQHVLAEEAEKIVKHYEDVLRTNLQQEDSSRAKRSKIETQLQNWINTFDQDIGEKQAQFDLLQEEYDKKKAEIDEVQKIIDEQEEEYDILMAEKEEEEERLFNEMAYQFFLDRSARKIQKYWRAYMEKKASRKKKGKKKK